MNMAQPLLDFITGSARMALPFLRKAAAAGVKAGAVIDVLRAFGLKFSTQRMLDVYAALQGRADLSRYLRIVPPTVTLPYEAHTEAVFNMRTNYQYVVRVFNPATQNEQYVTVVSEFPLAEVQIRAEVDTIFATGQKYQVPLDEYTDSDVSIVEANRSAGVV
jgi:hypothetical protein